MKTTNAQFVGRLFYSQWLHHASICFVINVHKNSRSKSMHARCVEKNLIGFLNLKLIKKSGHRLVRILVSSNLNKKRMSCQRQASGPLKNLLLHTAILTIPSHSLNLQELIKRKRIVTDGLHLLFAISSEITLIDSYKVLFSRYIRHSDLAQSLLILPHLFYQELVGDFLNSRW